MKICVRLQHLQHLQRLQRLQRLLPRPHPLRARVHPHLPNGNRAIRQSLTQAPLPAHAYVPGVSVLQAANIFQHSVSSLPVLFPDNKEIAFNKEMVEIHEYKPESASSCPFLSKPPEAAEGEFRVFRRQRSPGSRTPLSTAQGRPGSIYTPSASGGGGGPTG